MTSRMARSEQLKKKGADCAMARLIYVPVVHSIAEMGSAAAAYQAAFVARYGERKWAERTAKFDAIWRRHRRGDRALRLDLKNVKSVSGQLAGLWPREGAGSKTLRSRAAATISCWRPSAEWRSAGRHGIAQSSAG